MLRFTAGEKVRITNIQMLPSSVFKAPVEWHLMMRGLLSEHLSKKSIGRGSTVEITDINNVWAKVNRLVWLQVECLLPVGEPFPLIWFDVSLLVAVSCRGTVHILDLPKILNASLETCKESVSALRRLEYLQYSSAMLSVTSSGCAALLAVNKT